jgi:hypothetical protein
MAAKDARSLDHKTLAELRTLAVERVQAGEAAVDVACVLGVRVESVYRWLAKYRAGGWHALRAKPIPGRPTKLDGKAMGDVNVLDIMPIEAGAFYAMDRGYLDFARLYLIHQKTGAFFVTRAKRGMDARRVYSAPSDRGNGVICDQTIALNGFPRRALRNRPPMGTSK